MLPAGLRGTSLLRQREVNDHGIDWQVAEILCLVNVPRCPEHLSPLSLPLLCFAQVGCRARSLFVQGNHYPIWMGMETGLCHRRYIGAKNLNTAVLKLDRFVRWIGTWRKRCNRFCSGSFDFDYERFIRAGT